MKFLQNFNSIFLNRKINKLSSKYNWNSYTIEKDRYININGNVNIDYHFLKDFDLSSVYGSSKQIKSLKDIPLKFKNIDGSFICNYLGLDNLEGSPNRVEGIFRCNDNRLTSLEGGPEYVSGEYTCSNNIISSLKGSPINISGTFDCEDNQLFSLIDGPKYVKGNLYCSENSIFTFEGFPNIGGTLDIHKNPITPIWELFMIASKIELFNEYDIIRVESDIYPYKVTIILSRLIEFLKDINAYAPSELKLRSMLKNHPYTII